MPALRPAVFVALPHPIASRSNPRLLGVWHRASNRWALPGGKLEEGEELVAGARRELREETGLELSGTLRPLMRRQSEPCPDWPGRQPRDLIVFAATMPLEELEKVAGTTGPEGTAIAWISLSELDSFFGRRFVDALERRLR